MNFYDFSDAFIYAHYQREANETYRKIHDRMRFDNAKVLTNVREKDIGPLVQYPPPKPEDFVWLKRGSHNAR